ncbi:DUF2867 domain-containing protein [Amycolatopsis anabasis]|uniref:DUF2867 domain-containing protein n=1 Tax=Amycolatopsis anabasis TaxID=1840409 RepID=UPI002483F739|nr:DUF2867 domain-containing protein [Amycolatopsis anabasis]
MPTASTASSPSTHRRRIRRSTDETPEQRTHLPPLAPLVAQVERVEPRHRGTLRAAPEFGRQPVAQCRSPGAEPGEQPEELARASWCWQRPAEMANRTVHTVMHLGWVPNESGGYRGQMAVLVKPNGMFGKAYMAAIKPFRYLFVYPALMREFDRRWRAHVQQNHSGTT